MPSPEPTIVTLGGGGFSQNDDPRIDRWLLALTGKSRPNVCFVGTASGDAEPYLVKFYAAMSAFDCKPTHLPLFRRTGADPSAVLAAQDLVFVGGGNTANLLVIWRVHGVDRALRDVWQRGVVLAGVSAGALAWFESGLTDSFGPDLHPLRDGLAFLPGSFCPHYDGEPRRRPRYRAAIADGSLPPGHAADDDVAIRWSGTQPVEVVTSREGACAWRVGRDAEQPIAARLL